MKMFPCVLICVFNGLFLSCNTHPAPASAAEKLDAYFQHAFPADEPGGAVRISQHGKVLLEKGYGLADLQRRTPITPSTAFNTGSISKTFVMFGILLLEKEGKLSLDDPLITYFPSFKNKAIGEQVRIYHLLNHSSGLIDSRRIVEDSVFYLTAKDAENWAPILQNDSTAFEPGSQFAYSNPAFNALALIIEQISGRRWQDFIIERIFIPSGLTDSKITDGPYPESGVAHAYARQNGQFVEDDYGEEPTFPAAGNGGVWSSVRDLARYEQAIQQAIFLPKERIEQSRTPFQSPNWTGQSPSFIGYSWFIGTFEGTKIIYHTGDQGGFIADYVWVPEHQLHYTILCNTRKPTDEFRQMVLHTLLNP